MMRLSRYRKAFVAGAAGLALVATAVADDRVTSNEWWQIIGAILAVFGIWIVPNAPQGDIPPPRADDA